MATFTGTTSDDYIIPNVSSGSGPGAGADSLNGGAGNDTLDGGAGADTLQGGEGDDRLIWNAGGGGDLMDGGAGYDTLEVRGTNSRDTLTVSAGPSGHVALSPAAGVTVDADNIERLLLEPQAVGDGVTINDLGATDVREIRVDLSFNEGPDGALDTVTINGSVGPVWIDVNTTRSGAPGVPDRVEVNDILSDKGAVGDTGVMPATTIFFADSTDRLIVNGSADNDVLAVNGVADMQVMLNGGAGNDALVGGLGAETLNGGDGSDTITDGLGADNVNAGAGDDRIGSGWGNGSDTMDGGAGFDTLDFGGGGFVAQVGEIDIAGRAAHDLMTIFGPSGVDTVDLINIEVLNLSGHPEQDRFNIGDLSATRLQQIHIDLADINHKPDQVSDSVTLAGTAGANVIKLSAPTATDVVTVTGLPLTATVSNADGIDRLEIDAGAGADRIDASALPGYWLSTILSGDEGNDTIVGLAAGGSPATIGELLGGVGDDSIVGGASVSIIQGGSGDDILSGGSGFDRYWFVRGETGPFMGHGETGRDVILNFKPHDASGHHDTIEMTGQADRSFADMVAHHHIAQAGADVVVSDSTGIFATLKNIQLSSLNASDFLFG